MTEIVSIIIPYPPPELNPNKRKHWTVVSKLRKIQREDTYKITKEYTQENDYLWTLKDLVAEIDVYPPDHIRRDGDNILASLKGAIDGMFDALNPIDVKNKKMDDSQIKQYIINMHEKEKGGCVKICLSTMNL